MQATIWLLVFLLVTVVPGISSIELRDNTIGEHDCCPLKWTKMKIPGLIPIDAVVAGDYKGQKKYFSTLTHKFTEGSEEKIGVKTENNWEGVWYESHDEAFLFEPGCMMKKESEGHCMRDSPNDEVLILTNPRNCTIGWWRRQTTRQMPDETYQNLYLRIGGHYFARKWHRNWWDGGFMGAGSVEMMDKHEDSAPHRVSLFDELFPNRIPLSNEPEISGGAYREVYLWNVFDYPDSGTEILFLDCVSSASQVISAELVDISFDVKNLTSRTSEVVLDTTTIENNSSLEQRTEVTLSASIEKSFSLSYTTTASKTFHVGVSAGISAFGLLQIGFDADTTSRNWQQRGKSELTNTWRRRPKNKWYTNRPPLVRQWTTCRRRLKDKTSRSTQRTGLIFVILTGLLQMSLVLSKGSAFKTWNTFKLSTIP